MDSLTRDPAQVAVTPQNRTEIPDPRGLRSYIRKRPRSLIPYDMNRGPVLLFVRAWRWLLPWTQHDYPGRQKGIVEALGGQYTLNTLREWQKGKKPMSRVAAGLLADVIEARCKLGMILVEELEDYAAKASLRAKAGPGFRAIDPETGLSGRPRVGRKRKVKEV
jgi:hypothetical protein